MGRLIEKIKIFKSESVDEDFSYYVPTGKREGTNLDLEIWDKLGRIEDLEQQLGIDLVTLFELIGKDVYRIGRNKILPMTVEIIDNHEIMCTSWGEIDECALIKDFNKTWFLTEKEAQEALERKCGK